MHIAEVVTIAKSLPLLRLNTYKSLILSYSADYKEFFGKILPNGVEIFSKTEGSTFYFQSPLPYLCTCTITVDAKRKDPVEERKSERQMKIETSRKFLDCTIIAYSFLRNGYNFVLQMFWKMEFVYVGTCKTKLYGKSRNGVSFNRLACNRQKETLFLMPYY